MRRSPNGTRKFGRRYFLLANRGCKAEMQRDAAIRRAEGTDYVRVVPWNPFDPASLREALDDWALYVFPRDPRDSS